MTPQPVRRTVGAMVLALVLSPGVACGQLQAGPTLLEILPGRTSTELHLSNPGPEPVAAQVRAYAWAQLYGDDDLVRTDELAVSPPIVEIAPGGTQIVRLVDLGAPDPERDRSYRVIVDEIPSAEVREGRGVRLRMRYVIPAFVRAAEASPPRLACRIEAGRRLSCENEGGRPAQLGASRLTNDRGESRDLSDGLFGYVLAGSRRVWELEREWHDLHGAGVRLQTRVNGDPTIVVVEPAS